MATQKLGGQRLAPTSTTDSGDRRAQATLTPSKFDVSATTSHDADGTTHQITATNQSNGQPNKSKDVNSQVQLSYSASKMQKKVNKLTTGLETLQESGLYLTKGLTQESQNLNQKQQNQAKKQMNVQTELSGKLSIVKALKDELTKEVEEKTAQLKTQQDESVKKKNEVQSLKQIQQQIQNELKKEKDEKLNEKNQNLQSLSEKVNFLKQQIKEERDKRDTIEESIENSEGQTIEFALKLDDIGREVERKKKLDSTQADFTKIQETNQNFKDSIEQLRTKKEQNADKRDQIRQKRQQNERVLSPGIRFVDKRDQLQKELEAALLTNKTSYEKNLKLIEAAKRKQLEEQKQESRKIELTDTANLLKDQNRFEKRARKIQELFQNMEDSQKQMEDQAKEISYQLQQIATLSNEKNTELETKLKTVHEKLSLNVRDKDSLREDLTQVMRKVCNRPIIELQVDLMDDYQQELEDQAKKVVDFDVVRKDLAAQLEFIDEEADKYELSISKRYHKENDGISIEIQEKVKSLQQKLSMSSSKIQKSEQEVKVKGISPYPRQLTAAKNKAKKAGNDLDSENSLFTYNQANHSQNDEKIKRHVRKKKDGFSRQESVINDFARLNQTLIKQKERLDLIQATIDADLEEDMLKAQEQIKAAKEGVLLTKQEDCIGQIQKGMADIDNLDKLIQQLEAQAALLEEEIPLRAPHLQKDLQDLYSQINGLKGQKKVLMKELEDLDKIPNDQLAAQQAKIAQLMSDIEKMQNKDGEGVKKDADDLEAKLRESIRTQRNDKRKECRKILQASEVSLDQLTQALEKVEMELELQGVERDSIANINTYQDLLKTRDISSKLNQPLKNNLEQYAYYKGEKEALKLRLNSISQEVEELAQQHTGVSPVKGGKLPKQDEIVTEWVAKQEDIEKIRKDGEEQRVKVLELQGKVESLGGTLGDLSAEYRARDELYKKVIKQWEVKDSQLNEQKDLINKQYAVLIATESLMRANRPIASDNYQGKYVEDYNDNMKRLVETREKAKVLSTQAQQLKLKLQGIIKPARELGSRDVKTKELEGIRDRLDEMDVELKQLQVQTKDVDGQTRDHQQISDSMNKSSQEEKEKTAQRLVDNVQTDLSNLDQKAAIAAKRLKEFDDQLKETGKKPGDQAKQQKMRDLTKLVQDYDKQLRDINKEKEALKQKGHEIENALNKVNSGRDKKGGTVDYQNIIADAKAINQRAKQRAKEAEKISDDINKQSLGLTNYLDTFEKQQSLVDDLHQLIKETKAIYEGVTQDCQQEMALCSVLTDIVSEMEGAVDQDYKLKEGIIVKQKSILDDAQKDLKKIQLQTEAISSKKDAIIEFFRNRSKTADPQNLSDNIKEMDSIKEIVEKNDYILKGIGEKLNSIQKNVGDADIPIIIKSREKEFDEFIQKLKKCETEFTDLKRQLNQKGIKDMEHDIDQIHKAVVELQDGREAMRRIIQNELKTISKMPLGLMPKLISTNRTLGIDIKSHADYTDKVLRQIQFFKHQLCGMDLSKKLRELDHAEKDQRRRLLDIQKRLARLQDCADQCDGYHSNPDEGMFIQTLINERPDFDKTQEIGMTACEAIKKLITQAKRLSDDSSSVNNNEDSVDRDEQKAVDLIMEAEHKRDENGNLVKRLEEIVDKSEEQFLKQDPRKKLMKRDRELAEIGSICVDFSEQLFDLEQHALSGIERIDKNDLPLDEDGVPQLGHEGVSVARQELMDIAYEVGQLKDLVITQQKLQENTMNKLKNDMAQSSPSKSIRVTEVLKSLADNALVKKDIKDILNHLQEISQGMKTNKKKYHQVKARVEAVKKPKKKYRTVKGDLVDEIFGNYINDMEFPVPIQRLGNGYYTFGTRKVFAKIVNGQLLIRVGGGYMGIEEFMGYYGRQELQRLQKYDDEDDHHYVQHQHYSPVKTIKVDDLDEYGDEDDNLGVDIGRLSKQVRDRSKSARKGFQDKSADEEEKGEKGNRVIGIGEFRRALKQSQVEISHKESHAAVSGGDRSGISKKRGNNSTYVERDSHYAVDRSGLKPTPPRTGKKFEGELDQTPEGSYSSTKRPGTSGAVLSSVKSSSKIPGVKRKP